MVSRLVNGAPVMDMEDPAAHRETRQGVLTIEERPALGQLANDGDVRLSLVGIYRDESAVTL